VDAQRQRLIKKCEEDEPEVARVLKTEEGQNRKGPLSEVWLWARRKAYEYRTQSTHLN